MRFDNEMPCGLVIEPASLTSVMHMRTAVTLFEKLKPSLKAYGFSWDEIEVMEKAVYLHDIGLDTDFSDFKFGHELRGGKYIMNNASKFGEDADLLARLVANHGFYINFEDDKSFKFDFSGYENFRLESERDFEMLEVINFCDITSEYNRLVHSSIACNREISIAKSSMNDTAEYLYRKMYSIIGYFTDYFLDKYGVTDIKINEV